MIKKQILDAISMNSRRSTEDLAAMLNTGTDTIEHEIKEMEDNKVICGYPTLINWDRTDCEKVTALIEVKVTPQRDMGFNKAAAYDREAVEANMKKKAEMTAKDKIEEKPVFHGCPGTRMKIMDHKAEEVATEQTATVSSQLSQWPVQIKLVPVNAPYFKDANLLIAADCTAYAYGNFHQKFIKNKVTLIGCPKLDEGDYSEKLTQIIANNDIKSVTIVRMEVPCCGGLENAAKKAIQDSGKFLPWQVHTISIDGKILEA